MEWLETAPGASADAFRVLSRDPGACSFEQLVRGGTPGYDPQFPGSVPPHRHTHSIEVFEVIKGVMGYSVDGRLGRAGEGEKVSIPAGAAHFFYNAANAGQTQESRSDLVVRFVLVPCGSHTEFFDNLAGLAADAQGRSRIPLLQQVLLYHAHGLEMATMARWKWRLLAPVASPAARLLGYSAVYPEYRSAGDGLPA